MIYAPVATGSLDQFLSHIRSIKPLTAEREFELAVRYVETQDWEAAHELVVSHLPFVVKTAFQYRHYLIPVQDLIQEGTIGLMKAVKRFDPYKGYRLVSFAVWWIKAYIKNFIIKSWNLVKLGTTQVQKRLFFRMGDIGEHLNGDSRAKRLEEMAEELKVRPDDIIEMEARVKAREWSLNDAVVGENDLLGIDILEDKSPSQEEVLIELQEGASLSRTTHDALQKLDPRERFIVSRRFMDDDPWTLQKLGDHLGTSRERIRQLEKRALGKLRREMGPALTEPAIPADSV